MTKPIILSTPFHQKGYVIPKRYNFTMKRMKGMTLAEFIYHGGRNHEVEPAFFQVIIWYVYLKYYKYGGEGWDKNPREISDWIFGITRRR